MGFLSKLKRMLTPGLRDNPSLPRGRELRNHERFLLRRGEIARYILKMDDGRVITGLVRDISYGGIGLSLTNINPNFELPEDWQGELQVLDQTIECPAVKAHEKRDGQGKTFIGLSLHHETTDTLVFLRDVVENLRNGRSLEALDKALLNEPYTDSSWLCYRGDGPTDLKIKFVGSLVDQLLITFRSGGLYQEFSWKDNIIRTGTALNQLGPSAKMDYSAVPMPSVIRQAIYILAALPEDQLFDACHKALSAAVACLEKISRLEDTGPDRGDIGAA